MKKNRKRLLTPLRGVLAVGVMILAGEFVIMLLIESIHATFLTDLILEKWAYEFLDPLLLIAIVSPALYLLIFRPMRDQQSLLERQVDELQRFHRIAIDRELQMKALQAQNPLPVTTAPAQLAPFGETLPVENQHETDREHTALLFMLEDMERSHRLIEFSQQEWMSTINAIRDPMFLHDAEFKIVRVNRAYIERAGKSVEEIIGQPYYDIFPKTHAPMACCLRALENSGDEMEEEVSVGDLLFRSRSFSVKGKQGAYLYSVHILEDITERCALQEKVNFLAYHDRLTRLASRELFYDRLSRSISQARRSREYLALFFLDLDGFKAINDQYGHEAGDEVLKVTARRLLSCVREVDTVARLGGDEFAIVLGGIDKPDESALIADKIIQHLNQPIRLQDRSECYVGVSIGIAIYPDDAAEIDRLMSAADRAMYQSKAGGKNAHTFSKKAGCAADNAPWIVLKDKYLLGVPEIDRQHLDVAQLLNKLNTAVRNNDPADAISRLFDDLDKQMRDHFRDEENMMDASGYPDDQSHKREHQRLLRELIFLRGNFNQGGELLALQSLKDWLLAHVRGLDRQFANFLLRN